jgi:hypothetical protein
LLGALNAALAQPRCDIPFEVGQFVEALARMHEPDRELIRAIDEELGWLESRDSSASQEHQQWVAQMTQLLARRYPKLDTPLASSHLLVAFVGMISRWMAHSAPSNIERQQLIDGLVRMIRGSLAVPQRQRGPR